MSATVAAALKKIAVAILTDKKALKTVGGIILGILIIICLPVVSIISILNGDIQFDEARLQQIVVQNLSAEEQIRLQAVEDTMYAIDTAMRDRGFDAQRVKEAQVLYVLALSDCSGRSGFVQKLVGCFAEGQSDSQLIAAVNVAFGKEIDADEFSKIMNTIRAVYISTSGYVDPYTKNNLDLVTWAKNAKEKGWGYQKTPREMAEMLIKEVLTTTGITATAGIGTNMYLAKVAMDITAKKMPADENGVRIAELDEMSYRRELWTHRPLTDFWMVGRGISKKLEDNYMFTMGDVARCSQYNEAKVGTEITEGENELWL